VILLEAAPTVVHVVGDNTALYTVAGVVAGGLLGFMGSWLVQRQKAADDRAQLDRQIKEAKARLKEELAAEAKRLKDQLDHDRDMRERESLRNVIDAALDAARVQAIALGEAILKGEFGLPTPISGVGAAGSKLLIRLGRDHPVQQRYAGLRDELKAVAALVGARRDDATPDAQRSESTAAHEKAMQAMRAFADEAARLVGTPLAATSYRPTIASAASTEAVAATGPAVGPSESL
jgi:hypothetical protein